MGTAEDIARLQQEIRDGLNLSGVSLDKFAVHCFYEDEDSDDQAKVPKYVNKFTKRLTRPSSSPRMLGILERYRAILFMHPDYHQKGVLPPRNIPYPELDEQARRSMARISKKIDDALEERALMAEEAADDD